MPQNNHKTVELSPVGSLSNSSECLTSLDDSDLTRSVSSPEPDSIIKPTINKSSSPSQLTIDQTLRHHAPIMRLKDYLHALDRHKSIDNCFLSPSGDDRLYLFDEIKKITNHLFDITVHAEPNTNGDNDEYRATDNRVHDMNIQNLTITQTSAVDRTLDSNTSFKESNGGDVNVDMKSVKTCDESLDVNNNKINDNADEDDGLKRSKENVSRNAHPFSEIFRKFSSLADAGSHLMTIDQSNAPWPITTRRTKFRVNQMSSRDVPILKTDRPAKLQKQKAVDASDTKLFDEQIHHKSIFQSTPAPRAKNTIENLLATFEQERNQLFQSHFRHKTFIDRMPNGSNSFDCGQLGVEQRSINTIRSLFQLHASTGQKVKQIQAQIEAKNK